VPSFAQHRSHHHRNQSRRWDSFRKNFGPGRRSSRPPSDDRGVTDLPAHGFETAPDFLAFYDEALTQVYGYISARCSGRTIAEDLTSETFLAAVDAIRRDNSPPVSMPWIIGVARHKLVDHWRKAARDSSGLRAISDAYAGAEEIDLTDAHLDKVQARETLALLSPHHQAVLTLRYLDDLAVSEVARLLGRTVHATEALLVRARRAFRLAYEVTSDGDEETFDA
jgi:RNA polymerase sigma-70 factor, ECF subfamily